MDVITAFLQAHLTEVIYMKQPEKYEKFGPNGEVYVCRLKWALYGLKQAGRNWHLRLSDWLLKNRFKQSTVDSCLFIKEMENKSKFFTIAIYVDDLIIFDNDKNVRAQFVADIEKEFKMVDLGEAKWVLRICLMQKPGKILISQEKYRKEIIESFNMQNANTVNTPAIVTDWNKSVKPANKDLFLKLVGNLMYLASVTRPDVVYATGKAAQKMKDPTTEDWINAKRIFRYIKLYLNLEPTYSTDGNKELIDTAKNFKNFEGVWEVKFDWRSYKRGFFGCKQNVDIKKFFLLIG